VYNQQQPDRYRRRAPRRPSALPASGYTGAQGCLAEYVPGKFIHPHGGKFLKNGDLLIAEWMPDGRLTLLRRMRG
jgi:hypothetical protein